MEACKISINKRLYIPPKREIIETEEFENYKVIDTYTIITHKENWEEEYTQYLVHTLGIAKISAIIENWLAVHSLKFERQVSEWGSVYYHFTFPGFSTKTVVRLSDHKKKAPCATCEFRTDLMKLQSKKLSVLVERTLDKLYNNRLKYDCKKKLRSKQ